MQFRIADTFTASLAKLPNDQQRAAKTTAFDLQTNIAHPSLSLHRVTGARDPGFSSARVNLDLRIILHRAGENAVLCYVDSHDDAYRWAERRRLEVHPATGAAQLVELREVVQEVVVPVSVEAEQQAPPAPLPFAYLPDDQLLGYGVPLEWLEEVRAADEDSVLDLADHLPSEAAEALLELAVGKTPQPSLPAPSGADPFSHPDALRRFRVMRNVEELAEALEYPWEKWTIFLHPAQLGLVERNYNGPARVSGSAGTGKTVVALHRAAFLAKSNPDARILLTTFSDALANLLRAKLELLVHQEVPSNGKIVVDSLDAVGTSLYEAQFGPPQFAGRETIGALVEDAAVKDGTNFSQAFLLTEWERVVDAWQLDNWDDKGQVPSELTHLLELPGVGPYIASAVRCYAFSGTEAPVDTNVARVLVRLHGISPSRHEARRSPEVWELASELVGQDTETVRKINWALLDLGAQICTAREPKCSRCPLISGCRFAAA